MAPNLSLEAFKKLALSQLLACGCSVEKDEDASRKGVRGGAMPQRTNANEQYIGKGREDVVEEMLGVKV